MPQYVDPSTLEGQQLILHLIADEDFSVRVLGLLVGRIMIRLNAGNRVAWYWTVTGPYVPDHLRPAEGDAETLLAAKAAFRAKFDAWLAGAKELGHPVAWMG